MVPAVLIAPTTFRLVLPLDRRSAVAVVIIALPLIVRPEAPVVRSPETVIAPPVSASELLASIMPPAVNVAALIVNAPPELIVPLLTRLFADSVEAPLDPISPALFKAPVLVRVTALSLSNLPAAVTSMLEAFALAATTDETSPDTVRP